MLISKPLTVEAIRGSWTAVGEMSGKLPYRHVSRSRAPATAWIRGAVRCHPGDTRAGHVDPPLAGVALVRREATRRPRPRLPFFGRSTSRQRHRTEPQRWLPTSRFTAVYGLDPPCRAMTASRGLADCSPCQLPIGGNYVHEQQCPICQPQGIGRLFMRPLP